MASLGMDTAAAQRFLASGFLASGLLASLPVVRAGEASRRLFETLKLMRLTNIFSLVKLAA